MKKKSAKGTQAHQDAVTHNRAAGLKSNKAGTPKGSKARGQTDSGRKKPIGKGPGKIW